MTNNMIFAGIINWIYELYWTYDFAIIRFWYFKNEFKAIWPWSPIYLPNSLTLSMKLHQIMLYFDIIILIESE